MRNILVTGASGQLGTTLKKLSSQHKSDSFYFAGSNELDITNKDQILAFFKDKRITHVINCAAYTAVDKAEENRETAFLINASAPGYLAEVAYNYKVHMVHISTDFVFDGNHFIPYLESDIPHPLCAYADSKLAGEFKVKETEVNYTILRTSWLYSEYGNNFVKSMMKYGAERELLRVVFDQIGTPTYASDLAKVIMQVIEKEVFGLYHFSNEGVCSWYDFAHQIIQLSGIDCKVLPITTAEYPLPAKRPAYSVLNKGLIKKTLGIEIPHWQDRLKTCLAHL